jgi:hypothetical protein
MANNMGRYKGRAKLIMTAPPLPLLIYITKLLCPTEEDSGMLMSSVVVVHMCGWEGRKRRHWGLGKRTNNRAVDSKPEASKDRGL